MSMLSEMPRYQCHKRVWALQISVVDEIAGELEVLGGFQDLEVGVEWIERHKPEPGGYYVQYEGGYTSYSPKEAFEAGYTRIR